jgi:pentatricopeptide repeat protein
MVSDLMMGVLNACAHGGSVDEGLRYFHSMEKRYSIAPKIEHYGCMIDLLGRVGRLQEAYGMIKDYADEAQCGDMGYTVECVQSSQQC